MRLPPLAVPAMAPVGPELPDMLTSLRFTLRTVPLVSVSKRGAVSPEMECPSQSRIPLKVLTVGLLVLEYVTSWVNLYAPPILSIAAREDISVKVNVPSPRIVNDTVFSSAFADVTTFGDSPPLSRSFISPDTVDAGREVTLITSFLLLSLPVVVIVQVPSLFVPAVLLPSLILI